MILVLINAYGLEGTKLHLTVGKKRQVILQDDATFIKIVSQVVRFDEEVGDLYFKLKSKAWPLLISLYHRGLVKFLTHDYNEIPAKFLVSYSTIKSYDRETSEPELVILDRKRNIINPKVKHVRGNPMEQMKNFKRQQEETKMENVKNNQTENTENKATETPNNIKEFIKQVTKSAEKMTEEQFAELKAKAQEIIKTSEELKTAQEEAEKLASEIEEEIEKANTAKAAKTEETGLSTSTKVLLGAIGLGAITAAGWFLGKRIGLFGDASTVIETIDETVNN